MNLKEQIDLLLTDQLVEEMIGIRRYLHQFPELSFEEHQTSAYIRNILDNWGIEYDFPFVKTGILARIKGDHSGKRAILKSALSETFPDSRV